MNLFVLHESPYFAAKDHCDKHVVKMILETAQMLCTAHHVLDGDIVPDGIYKATHKNHPCSVWIRESSANYMWAAALFFCLCNEYTQRYGKIHKSHTKIRHIALSLPANIPIGKKTPFALAMPDKYKCDDPVQAYRNYYANEKYPIAKWNYSPTPSWFIGRAPFIVQHQPKQLMNYAS